MSALQVTPSRCHVAGAAAGVQRLSFAGSTGGDGSEEPGSRQVALDGAAALAQSNSARPRAGDGIEEALRRAIDTLQSSEVEDGIWVLSAEEVCAPARLVSTLPKLPALNGSKS